MNRGKGDGDDGYTDNLGVFHPYREGIDGYYDGDAGVFMVWRPGFDCFMSPSGQAIALTSEHGEWIDEEFHLFPEYQVEGVNGYTDSNGNFILYKTGINGSYNSVDGSFELFQDGVNGTWVDGKFQLSEEARVDGVNGGYEPWDWDPHSDFVLYQPGSNGWYEDGVDGWAGGKFNFFDYPWGEGV